MRGGWRGFLFGWIYSPFLAVEILADVLRDAQGRNRTQRRRVR